MRDLLRSLRLPGGLLLMDPPPSVGPQHLYPPMQVTGEFTRRWLGGADSAGARVGEEAIGRMTRSFAVFLVRVAGRKAL